MLLKLTEIEEKLALMAKLNSQLNDLKIEKLRDLYQNAIKNLKSLYEESFSLVDQYGDFYVMTNRIWVTTQNIYELFGKRSQQLVDEMSKNFIRNVQGFVGNV